MAGLVMKYFVLKPSGHDWHGEASRAALEAYENVLRQHGQIDFAEDLRMWRAECKAGVDALARDTANVRSSF